jgi:hypothetical protein
MKNKICIVVPFRNRDQHLEIFAPAMNNYLKNTGVEGDILIVEQADEKPFNRAKLLNVGFDYAEKNSQDYTYFCFHDVDMIPMESDYSYCDNPTHLASRAEQFGYKLPYDGYFGGVTIFDKESFKKINGYSNNYWGWGAEDDDVYARCSIMKIPRMRKDGMYQSLSHQREIPQELYHKNIENLRNMMFSFNGETFSEGLNTLEYELLEEIKNDLYKKIKVKL